MEMIDTLPVYVLYGSGCQQFNIWVAFLLFTVPRISFCNDFTLPVL